MKEQILSDMQDLVSTLRSPNFKQEKVRQLWREKQLRVLAAISKLSNQDLTWLESEYSLWHKANVLPHIDLDLRELAKSLKFNG